MSESVNWKFLVADFNFVKRMFVQNFDSRWDSCVNISARHKSNLHNFLSYSRSLPQSSRISFNFQRKIMSHNWKVAQEVNKAKQKQGRKIREKKKQKICERKRDGQNSEWKDGMQIITILWHAKLFDLNNLVKQIFFGANVKTVDKKFDS